MTCAVLSVLSFSNLSQLFKSRSSHPFLSSAHISADLKSQLSCSLCLVQSLLFFTNVHHVWSTFIPSSCCKVSPWLTLKHQFFGDSQPHFATISINIPQQESKNQSSLHFTHIFGHFFGWQKWGPRPGPKMADLRSRVVPRAGRGADLRTCHEDRSKWQGGWGGLQRPGRGDFWVANSRDQLTKPLESWCFGEKW